MQHVAIALNLMACGLVDVAVAAALRTTAAPPRHSPQARSDPAIISGSSIDSVNWAAGCTYTFLC